MARKKISEWKAKTLLFRALQIPYHGMVTSNELDENTRYVVKVDEGVKKRMKKGLVGLNKTKQEVEENIKKFQEEGYTHFIIEPFVPHEDSSEKYLSIERVRVGLQILYSSKGGIDVEDNRESIKKILIDYSLDNVQRDHKITVIEDAIGLEKNILINMIEAFDQYYFSFLEINPLVVENGKYYFLDIAAEVDSSAEFFVKGAWTEDDFRTPHVSIVPRSKEEENIDLLSQKSQASFNLSLLNPDGAIFMLLSGGGASIVLADEVYNLGYGKLLANYGEYSGNPNAEEVYIYAKNILELLLKSSYSKKVLLIGGGVANFTNISITFKGIIKALDEKRDELAKQQVKVFVRRGGPHQEEGLAMMESFLKKTDLFGLVADQKTTMPEIVKSAVDNL